MFTIVLLHQCIAHAAKNSSAKTFISQTDGERQSHGELSFLCVHGAMGKINAIVMNSFGLRFYFCIVQLVCSRFLG